jgi:hypothetical protein
VKPICVDAVKRHLFAQLAVKTNGQLSASHLETDTFLSAVGDKLTVELELI